MKHMILLTLFLCLSNVAFASTLQNIEICTLQMEDEHNAFNSQEIFDIKKNQSISDLHLGMINKYFQTHHEDANISVNFEQLQNDFVNGSERYNDLFLIEHTSKSTGKTYIEVRTYPGENPYGAVYNAATGEILAFNGDDDYYLYTSQGKIYCGDLISE